MVSRPFPAPDTCVLLYHRAASRLTERPPTASPPPPRAAILQAEDAFLEASIGKAAPSRRHPAGGENAVRGAAGQVAGLNMLNRRRRGGRVPAARQHSLGHGIPPKLEF